MNSIEQLKEKLKKVPAVVIRNKKKAAQKKDILENFKKIFKSFARKDHF